jgi:hypothetical protein
MFAGQITLTNNTPSNVDNASITRVFEITPATSGFGSGVITDVNIAVDFIKADGESFDSIGPSIPYFGEILLRLISPSGQLVNLIQAGDFDNGAPGTYFDGTIVFNQSATFPANVNPALLQPGEFRPSASLDALNSTSAQGSFTLLVQDLDTADSLRFRSATLTVTTSDPSSVPEPASMLLMPAAILALAGLARVQRASRNL